MSGAFGFGRALLARRPVGTLADFEAPVLDEKATFGQALGAILDRPEERRYDDILLHRCGEAADGTGCRRCGGGQWRRLPAAVVLEAAAGRMAHLASRDSLTGLLNRAAFFDHITSVTASEGDRVLDGEWLTGLDVLGAASSGRGGERRREDHLEDFAAPLQRRLALMFVDLDRLKGVNDSLGHNAGDALIRSIARRLRTASRPEDVVARLGGDEFAIACVVETPDAASAEVAARGIVERHLAAARQVDPDLDPRARSSASIGVALSGPLDGEGAVDGDVLLREADLAMYAAKQAGGDRWILASARGAGTVVDDASGEERPLSLASALDTGGLRLAALPVVDARSGAVVSAEAVALWDHPLAGVLGPDRVAHAARREHLTVALDRWVLDQAVALLADWDARAAAGPASGFDSSPEDVLGHLTGTGRLHRAPSVSVHLSTESLQHPSVAEGVAATLARYGVAPERLQLGLSETSVGAGGDGVVNGLAQLSQLGVGLVVDDLGAGGGSLRLLAQAGASVRTVKVDPALVAAIVEPSGRTVLRSLAALTEGLGVQMVARGVRSQVEIAQLAALGIHHLQGPAPSELRAAGVSVGAR
jgi:diguanylate cyclase